MHFDMMSATLGALAGLPTGLLIFAVKVLIRLQERLERIEKAVSAIGVRTALMRAHDDWAAEKLADMVAKSETRDAERRRASV